MKLQTIIDYLEDIFPLELAAEWDNVGLLLGDRSRNVEKVLTCLTIDAAVAKEAGAEGFDLIVSHHPFPFHAAKKWTTDTTDGKIMTTLLGAGIAVYSPHTAHDDAYFGINRQLAAGLDLADVKPLVPKNVLPTEKALAGLVAADARIVEKEVAPLGTGRIGVLCATTTLGKLAEQVENMLGEDGSLVVGDDGKKVKTVAIACGSADDFIDAAADAGADVMLLGEARFHACLEARARNLALIMPGHYATEKFAMAILAERIAQTFPKLAVKSSAAERDPIRRSSR